jgi:transposase
MSGSSDIWIEVKSPAKAAKEGGMHSLFTQRFEQGVEQIKESLYKKRGIKQQQKVAERIGRLKEKYSSTHKRYDIDITVNDKRIVTNIQWTQIPKERSKEGCYLLRTTLNQNEKATQWAVYNVIREVKAPFRVLKTDLDLRPIYHKTDDAAMAHLHLGLLAYWVVNTIRYQLKQKGFNNEWRDIVRIMNTQKIVTTTMKNQWEQQIQIRQCSEPSQAVAHFYQLMGYKPRPFTRKKAVVPPAELKKNEIPDLQCPPP